MMLLSFFSHVLGLQRHSVKPEHVRGVLIRTLLLHRFLTQFLENSGCLTSLRVAVEAIPTSVLSWYYTVIPRDPWVIESVRNKDPHFIISTPETQNS